MILSVAFPIRLMLLLALICRIFAWTTLKSNKLTQQAKFESHTPSLLYSQFCRLSSSARCSISQRTEEVQTETVCISNAAEICRSNNGIHDPRFKKDSNFLPSRRHFLTTTKTHATKVTTAILLGTGAISILPSPSLATIRDPRTGIELPEDGEIERSIPKVWTQEENPFVENGTLNKALFSRLDTTPDSKFYTEPRFVEHVDEQAVRTMTSYISNEVIKDGDSVLDLCSSWTSHILLEKKASLKRVSGLGMNEQELTKNNVLDDWQVSDLNENPQLPYNDKSFDVVLCQLSIDYLTRPLDVLKEVSRVLRPGGTVHILFSNRLFLSKAVALWTGADDIDHAYTVGCYLQFCNGSFQDIQAKDLSIRKGRDQRITGDPLYVVSAKKV